MKTAKKAIALIMCITICLTLLMSCSGGGAPTSSAPPPASSAPPSSDTGGPPQSQSKNSPWQKPDGSVDLDMVAYYDPDYDYTQNEKYKFMYMTNESPTSLHEKVSEGLAHWASVMNMESGGMVSSNGDPDMFLSMLQNLLDQGYRAFVADADVVMMEAVSEIMDAHPDAAWMTLMVPPRKVDFDDPDNPGDLLHPWAGFDYYVIGEMYVERLVQWRDEYYPDVPWSDIGFLSLDASWIPPLHQRVISSTAKFKEIGIPESNIFVADTAAYSFSIDGAIQACTPIVTTNEHIKYWVVNGLHDDFAAAAAIVLESVGLTETSCIVSMGGPGFQAQGDAGVQNAFRYVLSAPEYVQCEVFIGAIYAFLHDWAKPGNIWPMWVNKHDSGGAGKAYANMRLPAYWIDFNDYKAFFQWSAVYAEANDFNYGIPNITRDSWPNRVAVPAHYN